MSKSQGVRWIVTSRGFGFTLPMQQYQILKRAAGQMRWESLPWEASDELWDCLVFPLREDKNGNMRFVIPGRLYSPLKEALTLAKDGCNPRYASEFAWLIEQVERFNEARSAIDRLGDLGA